MLDKVRNIIQKFNMLEAEDTVIVALSGGADSVCLLHVLKALGYKVRALHVNHLLRGEESERDEFFVRRLCQQLSVELEVCREDIAALASESRLGLEECGRQVRYRLLQESASAHRAKIATAHTLSDSTETVLLNIARGCSIDGLSGIPAVRGNIVRPLIELTRQDIECYCKDNALEYVTDSSNLGDDYARNRIRHNTVPSLKSVNPSLEAAVCRMTQLAARDAEYLTEMARQAAHEAMTDRGYDVCLLSKNHSSILSRIILRAVQELTGVNCGMLHVERVMQLIERRSGKVQLPGNACAVISHGVLRFERTDTAELPDWEEKLQYPETMLPDGRILRLTLTDMKTFEEMMKNNKYLFKNALDYDRINSKAYVRSRRSGDRLRQIGRGVTKELRRLMNEASIPAFRRSAIPVLADDNGVVWVECFGTDESRKVTNNTENVVVIEVVEKVQNG